MRGCTLEEETRIKNIKPLFMADINPENTDIILLGKKYKISRPTALTWFSEWIVLHNDVYKIEVKKEVIKEKKRNNMREMRTPPQSYKDLLILEDETEEVTVRNILEKNGIKK